MTSRITHRSLIAYAIGFLLFFLCTSFVVPLLASSDLPLPDAPAEEARRWFADNPSAAVVLSVCQLLSVACLSGFAITLRRATAAAGKANVWAQLAVACMTVSSLLTWLLVATAPTASVDTVAALRTANFIAGGTAHVAALGVFVLLASRTPVFGKAIRVFAVVAAVPAIASLVSLVWYQGALLILLGRLLCMIWTISAAVSATRHATRRRATASQQVRTS